MCHITVRGLVVLVGFRVKRRGMYYAYESPHKDNLRCVCVYMPVCFITHRFKVDIDDAKIILPPSY